MHGREFRQMFNEAVGESVKRHGHLQISEPEMTLLLADQAILWHVGGYARLDDEIISHQQRLWWEWVCSLSGPSRHELLDALRSSGCPIPPLPVDLVIG